MLSSYVFTFPEGEATLRIPATLSQESCRDLEDWLDLMLRKAKRAAGSVSVSGPPKLGPIVISCRPKASSCRDLDPAGLSVESVKLPE